MVRLSSSRLFTIISSAVSIGFFISTLNVLMLDKEEEESKKQSKVVIETKVKDPPSKFQPLGEVYFDNLPGTNWTLFDIRRGKQGSGRRESVGVRGELDPSKWKHVDQIMASSKNYTSMSHIVVYNRVPKCASTTMLALIKLLAARNGFKFVSSQIYWRLARVGHWFLITKTNVCSDKS